MFIGVGSLLLKTLISKIRFGEFLALEFLGGLLALLTPCVFPMIPLTVSFFTKKAGNSTSKLDLSKAILYGVFIVLVYLILSIPFHLLDSVNPDILNEISTNVWLNVIFFLIFIFCIFIFWILRINTSSKLDICNKQRQGIGGILGVFYGANALYCFIFVYRSYFGFALGEFVIF